MTFKNHSFAHISVNLLSLWRRKIGAPITQSLWMPVSELLCGNHEKCIFSNKIYTYFASKRWNNRNYKKKCHHLRQEMDVFRVLSGFWTTSPNQRNLRLGAGGIFEIGGGWTIHADNVSQSRALDRSTLTCEGEHLAIGRYKAHVHEISLFSGGLFPS